MHPRSHSAARLLALAIALAAATDATHAAEEAPVPSCAPDEIPGLGGECIPGTGGGPQFAGDPRMVRHEVDGMAFNVLLPANYAQTNKRYPVLYLLHAFGENQDGWLVNSDLLEFTSGQDVIVVLPNAGNSVAFFFDGRDGSCRSETQLIAGVMPFVDGHYRTLPERAHRALAGASGGATSAAHLAAAHPDLFVAAASMSGPPDFLAVNPLVGQVYLLQAERAALVECGGNPATGGLFGTPIRDEIWVRNANPSDLAANLRGMSLFIAAGNGQPCDAEDLPDIHRMPTTTITSASAASFAQALDREGIAYRADLGHCGFHSWRYFQKELHEFWPQMLEAFGAAPPVLFDYRRADPEFSAWDWNFAADPRRAPEFLEIRRASASGATFVGSGLTTVTTAPLYAPHQRVRMDDGEAMQVLRAGEDGRLRFTVDLGAPHQNQQYTTENGPAEQAPDYFAQKSVRLEAVGTGQGSTPGGLRAGTSASGGGGGLDWLTLWLAALVSFARRRRRPTCPAGARGHSTGVACQYVPSECG